MPIVLGERTACQTVADATEEIVDPVQEDWRRYRSSGSVAARNRLITHYMKAHVRPIAARIRAGLPGAVDLEDLVQQGYFGLIDAMDRYDIERDIRFETFSRQRIYGAIQDYLRAIDPMPRLTRSRSKRVQQVAERFAIEHGRPPGVEELRERLDLPDAVVERYVTQPRPAVMVAFCNASPESGGGDDGDSDAMDGFEDAGAIGPVECVARRDLQRWLMRELEPRDRLIVVLYYYEHMTMREIGQTVGCSESRVSQRLDSILGCLRARLGRIGAEQEFIFR